MRQSPLHSWLAAAGLSSLAAPALFAAADGFTFPDAPPMEVVASGFNNLEGPAWDAEEGALYFSDQSGSCAVYRWTEDAGAEIHRYYGVGQKVNGNAVDAQGRLVTCESKRRRVVIEELDGSLTPLPQSFEGKALNEPNDVVVKSDGTIWFTTPTWSSAEAARQYVLRFDPETGAYTKMVDGIDKPNGLGFSPDEKTFYLNDNGANRVLAYPVLENGSLGAMQVLVPNVDEWPDGMAVDAYGNIFMAAWGGSDVGINVFDPEGNPLGRLAIPGVTQSVTNCAFGGPNNRWLFVTAGSSLWRIDLTAAYPPLPTLAHLERKDASTLQLTFDAHPAFSYVVEHSTDGSTWEANGEPLSATAEETVTLDVPAAEADGLWRVRAVNK